MKRNNNTFASIEYIYVVWGKFTPKGFGTETTNRTNVSKGQKLNLVTYYVPLKGAMEWINDAKNFIWNLWKNWQEYSRKCTFSSLFSNLGFSELNLDHV